MPYVSTCFGAWALKLDLIEETALKCFVQIVGEIGCGNQNAVEVFHFLQNDVLHCIAHLIDTTLHIGQSLAEDRIGLIEQQNWGGFAFLGKRTVLVKDALDVLLALCDRILVMCQGQVTGIVDARTTTKEEVGLLMTSTEKEEEVKENA